MESTEALFGKIALKNKLLTDEQLEECVTLRRMGSKKPLGEILLEKGFINEKQFRAIVQYIQQKAQTASQPQTAVAEEEPAPPPPPAREKRESAPAEPRKAGGGPLPPITELLTRAKKMGASDLHISIATKPFVRYHGELKYFEEYATLDADTTQRRIFEILTPDQQKKFTERNDLDTCLELAGVGRFRTSILRQRRGVAGVFRIIRDKVPSLEDLGIPEIVRKFTTYHQGIVLITGSTGSGKSSTLAALVEIVNQTRKDHVITLEDPIEYVFDCKKANVSQRQIEQHTHSWGNALRAALREDPDVIMVGEMRDLDTMRLAVTAAETGHLVLATLHTTNATRTIDRLLDVFPPKEQSQIRAMVSESLRGVVSQQLIPRADGKGRVAACEILFSTPAVANLIREKRTFQLYSVLQTGKKLGMKLMDDALEDLLKQKIITKEQARFRAQNPKRFEAK
jgi:twitching motility protein PilT